MTSVEQLGLLGGRRRRAARCGSCRSGSRRPSAPKSRTRQSPSRMRRPSGRWWGMAAFGPPATMVSKLGPSAPRRRISCRGPGRSRPRSARRRAGRARRPGPRRRCRAACSMRATSPASFTARRSSTSPPSAPARLRGRAGRSRCWSAQVTWSASSPSGRCAPAPRPATSRLGLLRPARRPRGPRRRRRPAPPRPGPRSGRR